MNSRTIIATAVVLMMTCMTCLPMVETGSGERWEQTADYDFGGGSLDDVTIGGNGGDDSDEDSVIEANVDRVKQAVSDLLERGLRERAGIFT